jgi:hypothetical protein
MKLWIICFAVSASLGLGACHKPAATADAPLAARHGRYVGIGIYTPGTPWTKMVAAGSPQDTPAARAIDDQAIIVVTDSDTGEIRACGDLTGYCIGMNPWNKALVPSQAAPINLTEHVTPPDDAADSTRTPRHPSRRPRHRPRHPETVGGTPVAARQTVPPASR